MAKILWMASKKLTKLKKCQKITHYISLIKVEPRKQMSHQENTIVTKQKSAILRKDVYFDEDVIDKMSS